MKRWDLNSAAARLESAHELLEIATHLVDSSHVDATAEGDEDAASYLEDLAGSLEDFLEAIDDVPAHLRELAGRSTAVDAT